ncbi:MAG: carbohydrate binding family 9 domain-containing protein [Planctomycetes bacterium]|nr:carbohydrate binding family 9 domain-containing protein [Planctomycetota bacterium]
MATAVRILKGPTVDGRLDDEVWKQAPAAGPLIQVVPVEGAEPSERTEFRVLYDDQALYIGVWCFDREPEKVLSREMARDGKVYEDDYITIALDTFHDQRNCYLFTVNPNGAKLDFLITNNTEANEDWDGIWDAAGSIDGEGWKVEIEFPFKSFSFDPANEVWGLNVERFIPRSNERARWSRPSPKLWSYNAAEAGDLIGLRDLKQGIGLEIIPYALARYRNDRAGDRDTVNFDGGGDARYRILPNLTASLSYNMDFAETEVDERRINLTRFPLFFPEKRDFFLEDSGIFRFGGLGTELLPFFSRRIGLAAGGEAVPIVLAGKLAGRLNGYSVGVIDTLVDAHDGLGERNALVLRASKDLFDQSSAGIIATHGDPNSEADSFLGSADFRFRTSELLGNNVLEASAFVLGSATEGAAGDDPFAFGGKVEMPNDLYWAKLQFYQVGEDFNAALGFVPRKGVRAYTSGLSYNPRPEGSEFIRQVFISYSNEHYTDLNGNLDTADHLFYPFYVNLHSGDEFFFNLDYHLDAPAEDFEISEGIVIPPGNYWWLNYKTGFKTASKRPADLAFDYTFGDFYEGRHDRYTLQGAARAGKYLAMRIGYTLERVWLPEGDFEVRLAWARLQASLSPRLQWFHLLQYDDLSNTLGYQSRVRWEFRPGANAFIVLNQSIDRNHGSLRWLQSELAMKVEVSFRF